MKPYYNTTGVGSRRRVVRDRLDVNGVHVSGVRCGRPATWWEVGPRDAGRLVRRLRPGWQLPGPDSDVDMPSSVKDGQPGRWVLINRDGDYELKFYRHSR